MSSVEDEIKFENFIKRLRKSSRNIIRKMKILSILVKIYQNEIK